MQRGSDGDDFRVVLDTLELSDPRREQPGTDDVIEQVSTTSVTDERSMPAASSRGANCPARGKSGNSIPIPASMSIVRPRLRTTTTFSAQSNVSGRNISFSQAARAAGSAFVDIVAAGIANTPSLTTSTSTSPTRSA
jgi:hypothetical protein